MQKLGADADRYEDVSADLASLSEDALREAKDAGDQRLATRRRFLYLTDSQCYPGSAPLPTHLNAGNWWRINIASIDDVSLGQLRPLSESAFVPRNAEQLTAYLRVVAAIIAALLLWHATVYAPAMPDADAIADEVFKRLSEAGRPGEPDVPRPPG